MKESNKKMTFPVLIHSFEIEIEKEISELRNTREKIATQLKRLRELLAQWDKKGNYGVSDAIEFVVKNRDYQNDLLAIWGEANEVPAAVKIEKYTEIYDVPDFSKIVECAEFLRKFRSDLEKYRGDSPNEVVTPATTQEEKEAIVKKHSVYLKTQREHDAYAAICLILEGVNLVNFKWSIHNENRINIGKVRQLLPYQLGGFISLEPVKDGTKRRQLVFNFNLLKDLSLENGFN